MSCFNTLHLVTTEDEDGNITHDYVPPVKDEVRENGFLPKAAFEGFHKCFDKLPEQGAVKDNVNNPHHYNHKGVECIAAIEASMGPDEFKGYLKGNIIKYNWRYRYKNGIEDLKKAQWYLNKLITTWENKDV